MTESHHAKSLLQLIDRKQFDELCLKWQMDKGVRRFTTWDETATLILCRLLSLGSLREVEEVLSVPRSTLDDAMRKRGYGFFQELCSLVLKQLLQATRARKVRRAVRQLLAMDATSIRLNGRLADTNWGKQRRKKRAAAKLTVVWNIHDEWIEDFRISPGFHYDSPIANQITIQPGATYIFDRGYSNLDFWWKLVCHKAHFVTRLKDSEGRREERAPLLKGKDGKCGVLWDGQWQPKWQSLYRHPRLPEDISFRRVLYRDEQTGRLFDFITSDRKLSAQTVADFYQKRWAIELLFRWLKGHLHLRYLDTRNKNAIKTQLAVAILVRLLLQLKKTIERSKQTAWQLLRGIRGMLARDGLAGIGYNNPYLSQPPPSLSAPG